MKTKLPAQIPGMMLAVLLSLLVGRAPVFAHGDRDGSEHSQLVGTWNVALTFVPIPTCNGGGPVPTLNTFLKGGEGCSFPPPAYSLAPGRGRESALGTTISRPASSSCSSTPTAAAVAARG